MINRRNFISKLKFLSAVPFLGILNYNNKLEASTSVSYDGEFKFDSLEYEIEKIFIDFCEKNKDFYIGTTPYNVDGIFLDEYSHRQRLVGCYWFWFNGKGCGGSMCFTIKEMHDKFGSNFSFIKWEQAVNAVHNKYTGHNRTLLSHSSKYYDNL